MIFFICGPSGSGKDTLVDNIINDNKFNLKKLVYYTSRLKREKEIEGESYFFISKEKAIILNKDAFDFRCYNGWYYLTTEQLVCDNINYIVQGSLDMLENYINRFNNNILPIYVNVNDKNISNRLYLRESFNKGIGGQNEILRRIKSDLLEFDIIKKTRIKTKTKKWLDLDNNGVITNSIIELEKYIEQNI